MNLGVNFGEEKVIWEGRLIYANAWRQSRSWHIQEVKENQSVLCKPHPLSVSGNQLCAQTIEYCKGEKDIHDYMYVINCHKIATHFVRRLFLSFRL